MRRPLLRTPLPVACAAAVTVVSSLLAGRIERFARGYYDEGIYRLLARNLLQHQYFGYAPGVNVAARPPGYPFFLAAIRWLVDGQWAVRIVQALLAGGTVLLAAWIAFRLYDRAVASVTAILLAVTGVLAAYASFELSETLATFLLVAAVAAALFAVERESVRWMAGSGVLLGLSILTRPQALVVVPFLAVWAGLTSRRALAVVVVAVSLATITPWTVRNAVRLHAFVPVSTYGGVNFWMVNNSASTGRYPGSVAFMVPAGEYARITALPEAEQDREWYRLAISYIRDHPLTTLRNWLRNGAIYAGARDHYPADRLVFRGRVRLPLLDDRGLWVPGLLAGVIALRRRRVRELLPAAIIVPFVLFFMLFLPLSRYRHGLHPFLAVYAAAGVVAAWRFVRGRRGDG